MKKWFYLGVILMALTSCGSSSETTDAVMIEEVDTFGSDVPVEVQESVILYEGTGNMSDSRGQ